MPVGPGVGSTVGPGVGSRVGSGVGSDVGPGVGGTNPVGSGVGESEGVGCGRIIPPPPPPPTPGMPMPGKPGPGEDALPPPVATPGKPEEPALPGEKSRGNMSGPPCGDTAPITGSPSSEEAPNTEAIGTSGIATPVIGGASLAGDNATRRFLDLSATPPILNPGERSAIAESTDDPAALAEKPEVPPVVKTRPKTAAAMVTPLNPIRPILRPVLDTGIFIRVSYNILRELNTSQHHGFQI